MVWSFITDIQDCCLIQPPPSWTNSEMNSCNISYWRTQIFLTLCGSGTEWMWYRHTWRQWGILMVHSCLKGWVQNQFWSSHCHIPMLTKSEFSMVTKSKTNFRLSLKLDGTLSSIITLKLANTEPCHKYEPTKEVLTSAKRERPWHTIEHTAARPKIMYGTVHRKGNDNSVCRLTVFR